MQAFQLCRYLRNGKIMSRLFIERNPVFLPHRTGRRRKSTSNSETPQRNTTYAPFFHRSKSVRRLGRTQGHAHCPIYHSYRQFVEIGQKIDAAAVKTRLSLFSEWKSCVFLSHHNKTGDWFLRTTPMIKPRQEWTYRIGAMSRLPSLINSVGVHALLMDKVHKFQSRGSISGTVSNRIESGIWDSNWNVIGWSLDKGGVRQEVLAPLNIFGQVDKGKGNTRYWLSLY